jgi:hypothetical protein
VAFAVRHADDTAAWAARRVGSRIAVAFGCHAVITAAGLATVAGGALAVAHGGALAPGAMVTPALMVCALVAAITTARSEGSATRLRVRAQPKLAGVS